MYPDLIQKRGAVHLADETSVASSDRPNLNPPVNLLALIPESVARENVIVPLALEGETLTCAAAKAGDVLLADKLGFMLNKRVRLVQYPQAIIQEAINLHYGQTETESVDSMLTEFNDTSVFSSESCAGGGDLDEHLYRSRGMPPPAAQSPPIQRMRRPVKSAQAWRSADVMLEHKNRAKRIEDETDDEDDEDTTPDESESMWYYTVDEGQRALMIRRDGRMEVLVGPKRVWKGWNRFEKMRHFVAHPGEFLIVRFRDGRQEHLTGPADLWFDPRTHEQVTRQDALQLAAKEAVIVYNRPADSGAVSRRMVYGPTLFVPAPGEWLHTFAWHGSEGGSQGQKKVAKGLVFQKLWLMPDQMYHDVTDVRTSDDAVLTIKLMMFFELLDIDRMLETTHDPIGDFINAATSDVVDFCGQRTFEVFKHETGKLNELDAYRQLTARAAQNGYRVNKVVYRGYGAPDRLQAMHDQAIESRTKLQLERATEEQAQNLEDYKLNAQMNRAARRRTEQAIEVETEIDLATKRQEAEARQREAERTAAREQHRRDAETEQELRRQAEERTRQHLAALKEMGVDLTAYLTQGRADRVIELRGGKGSSPHIHLDQSNGDRGG